MEQSGIPSWFHQVWTAVPELGRRTMGGFARESSPALISCVGGEKSPVLSRFESYIANQFRGLPPRPIRLDLDRLIVRLAIKLHRSLAIIKSDDDRLQAVLAFLVALDAIEELRLDHVEPPELEREVQVEVPSSQRALRPEAGGLWFAQSEVSGDMDIDDDTVIS